MLEVLLPGWHEEGIVGVCEQLATAARAQLLDDGGMQEPAHVGLAGRQGMQEGALIVDSHPGFANERPIAVCRLPALGRCRGSTQMLDRPPARHDGVRGLDAPRACPGDVRADGLPASTTQIGRVVSGEVQNPLSKPESRKPPPPQPQVRTNALAGGATAQVELGTRYHTEQCDQVWKLGQSPRQTRRRVTARMAQNTCASTRPGEPRTAIAGRSLAASVGDATALLPVCPSNCARIWMAGCYSRQHQLCGLRTHAACIGAIPTLLEEARPTRRIDSAHLP